MATFDQVPGELNLDLQRGDQIDINIDFSIALTGYTVTSKIVSLVDGSEVATPTVAITNEATGIVSFALSETQTTMDVGTYRWYLDWVAPGSVGRRVLSGLLEVRR